MDYQEGFIELVKVIFFSYQGRGFPWGHLFNDLEKILKKIDNPKPLIPVISTLMTMEEFHGSGILTWGKKLLEQWWEGPGDLQIPSAEEEIL